MTHYCPVCYKEIPESAYSNTYRGCIQFYGLDKKTGLVATAQGTIKLGEKPGEFDSVFPKKIFTDCYDELRTMQKKGSVRVSQCHQR